MKFDKGCGFERAMEVKPKVKKALEDLRLAGDFYFWPYQNGREDGLGIIAHRQCSDATGGKSKTCWVAWAENRNSDDMVVYSDAGLPNTYGVGGGITEKAYQERAFLSPYQNKNWKQNVVKVIVERVKTLLS